MALVKLWDWLVLSAITCARRCMGSVMVWDWLLLGPALLNSAALLGLEFLATFMSKSNVNTGWLALDLHGMRHKLIQLPPWCVLHLPSCCVLMAGVVRALAPQQQPQQLWC